MHNLYDAHSHSVYNSTVKTILCATDRASWYYVLEQKSQTISAAVGIHPWFLDHIAKGWDKELETLLSESPDLIIGECGLDFYKDIDRKIQKIVFCKQLELAQKFGRPVVIHAVKAINEVLSCLKKYPLVRRFVVHRFSGSLTEAKSLIANGAFLSLGFEVLERKKSRKLVENIPLSNLLLETDAETDNDDVTSRLQELYAFVAKVKEVSLSDLMKIIKDNYYRFVRV